MRLALEPTLIAPAGSTGNTTLPAPNNISQVKNFGKAVALNFVVEAVGGTPTVTYKFQGSIDGLTWYDVAYTVPANDTLAVATQTVTGLGGNIQFLEAPQQRNWNYFRVVTTSNTNVTFRAEAWVEAGPNG